jgi:hypothetical protein
VETIAAATATATIAGKKNIQCHLGNSEDMNLLI